MNTIKSFLIDNLSGFSPKAIPNFIFSFLICALLAFLLGKLYIKYGHTLSNRKTFARNFILLSLATMFIITVVKSSLALSLGLVGALSIVRFRAAIKEPEELIYLFLCISIGLGCGAGMTVLTIVAFAGFVCVVLVLRKSSEFAGNHSLYLTISGNNAQLDLTKVIDALKPHCSSLKLKRSDDSSGILEVSFLVDFENFSDLENAKAGIKMIGDQISISVIDNSRDF